MTLLVTGHRGFVGGCLLNCCPDAVGLDDADGKAVDLLDPAAVSEATARLRPTSVVHLAAQSAVPESFADPEGTFRTNVIGTQNLFASLKAGGFTGRVLFVSTAEVYGSALSDALPASEQTPLLPLNPYAVSKVAAEALCSYWHRVEGLDVIVVRPFNHIGPGQSSRFAIADFAQAIVEMRLGRREPVLQVGDLDVTRDFTDVRDVVAAYQALLLKGESGATYNVCSGIEQNMRQAVHTLAELADVRIEIQVDSARLRKSGQKRACGNPGKLRGQTAWAPRISWRQSLKDIINDWENKLA